MKNLLESVKQIVLKASDLFSNTFEVNEKEGKDNVCTSTDLAIQEFLVKELKKLLPESGFFCEEENLQDTTKEYTWIIDPIDGTYNFFRNNPGFTISVGLKKNNEMILGVVYDPTAKELFSAEKDKGAYLNDKPIHVSNFPFKKALFATAMSVYRKEYADLCNSVIMDAYKECSDLRRYGSAALELCYLACGRVDLYFELRVFPWDIAAGYIIVKEAGGFISSLNKEKFDWKAPKITIGANNKDNFDKIIDIVNKHIRKAPYDS